MCKKLIHSANFILSSIFSSNLPIAGIFKSYIRFCSNVRMLIVLSVMILSSSAFPQWTRTNGPEGVSVSFLINIDGTIYAGTKVNGVYISTDDGLNWTARNAGIENYGISSIISNQGFIYVGTYGQGVYRSSDGGQTWLPPTNGSNLFITSLVYNDPYIYAGAASLGLYRSSDNGATWSLVTSGSNVDEMCVSGNKLFISEYGYTYTTTDHGVTWDLVEDLLGAAVFSYYCIGDTIFVGDRNKIYRSTDNGNNFVEIDIPFSFSIVNIYSITSFGSTVFAATSYDGVYKSTDFGNTWFSANLGMGPKNVRAVTLTNASTLIAGSHYVGMYRSTDDGASWNKSNSGFPAGISILSLLGSETGIYAGTRDGVYQTEDNGNSWTKLTGTNDTVNYCTVWDMCELDGDIYVSMFLQFNTTVYKTTDKGVTWIRCDNGLPINNPFIKGLVSSGENVIAGTNEGIYYTSDRGVSWNPTNAPTHYIPSMDASGDFVYAIVPSIGIYRSLNNGVSWILALQSNVDYVVVAAIDNYAFAGAFFDGARYSSNNGNTWNASVGFPFEASVFALGPVADGLILAGTDQEPNWIYYSVNYGASYQPYSEGLAERASVEAFAVNDTFMFAGTDDHGVWRRLRPGIVSVETEQEIPQGFNLAQNYPNPFNPTTTIRYSIAESATVKLTVYNTLGEAVRTLVNNYKDAGTYTINFNASDLSSGIYYYRLQAGTLTETKKMVIMK